MSNVSRQENHTVSTNVMPEAQAVELFLKFHTPHGGVHIFSGFVHALKEARSETGRDTQSGTKLPSSHGSWLGAVGYFALLDQVGKCFKPRNMTQRTGNAIQQALGHFTNLSANEIDALYALRCAFAHDYSLYNINQKNPTMMHNFIVGQGASPLMTMARVPWNGDLQNQVADCKTSVSLEAFADVVEQVVQQIIACSQSNNLEILLPGGSDELVRRYMFAS
jgi:hypothetical protein